MKNKYIFLIIALGFGAYFLIRPQTGMSGADMQQAQAMTTIMQRLCSFSNNSVICNLLTRGPSATGGTTGVGGSSGNNTPQVITAGRGPISSGGGTGGNTGGGNTMSPAVMTIGGRPFDPNQTFTFTDNNGNDFYAQLMQCGNAHCPRDTYQRCLPRGPICISCFVNGVNIRC